MLNYNTLKVRGTYLDHPVCGTIESSRVAYGGRVKHTVVLDEPIQLPWRTELTTTVILDHGNIEVVSEL